MASRSVSRRCLGERQSLSHDANDAASELHGCIAPVTTLTGDGRGSESRKALDKLKTLVYSLCDMEGEVFLLIKDERILTTQY